jgi:hypothetical protein
VQEYDCTREGMTLIDQDVINQVNEVLAKQPPGSQEREDLNARLTPILNNRGKCVECGRNGDLPCDGMDFDGCMVAEGFMLDQDVVRFRPVLFWGCPRGVACELSCLLPEGDVLNKN